MIDAYASQPHYFDHIWPIWEKLTNKGTFYVSPSTQRPGEPIRGFRRSDVPLIVAGYTDCKRAMRPIIFVEHGIGENYGGADPHYSGGKDRERVELFICPNRHVAEANEKRYPGRSVVAGSPRVEWLAQVKREEESARGGRRDGRLRVAVSFHWNCHVYPQTRTALFDYQSSFRHWATDPRIELIGHAHPRIAGRAEKIYAAAGIPFVPKFEDVISWADFYAVDNSSTLFEAAALGLDVILFNAPHYPPDDVGFRFWRHAGIGPQMNPGDELGEVVANYTRVTYDEARADMVAEIFGTLEGSAQRAADAIEATYDNTRTPSSPPSTDTSADQTQPSLFDRV